MKRALLLGLALTACALACDTFDSYDCDERIAGAIVYASVEEGAPLPSCEEACPKNRFTGTVVACALLPDDVEDAGGADGASDAASPTRPSRAVKRYYCESEGAQGACHR